MVGTWGGTVEAFGALEGENRWTFEGEFDFVVSSPAVADGHVYVGTGAAGSTGDAGHLYALDAAKGTERWRFVAGEKILSSPAIAGETLYVGSADSHLYALDATTGEKGWEFDTGGDAPIFDGVDSSPAVVDGTVYVASTTSNSIGHVFAIE